MQPDRRWSRMAHCSRSGRGSLMETIMRAFHEPFASAGGRHGSLAPFRRALRRLSAAEARHRDARRLAALSDQLLADIGLTRDAVRRPRW